MEIIQADTRIIDNILEINIDEEKALDNSQYEIRIKGLRSKDGKAFLDGYKTKVVTELTPSYCKISDVAVLVDIFNIPESTILYYIREASKYVDYILGGTKVGGSGKTKEATFPMTEFVKTKVKIDCLMKAYVHKAAGEGISGALGVISFQNTEKYAMSIDDILDDLWRQLKGWEEALKGYEFEGRAEPRFAIRASKATGVTTPSSILTSIDRDSPRNLP